MEQSKPLFHKKISPLNAWAFSFACMIGWAAFVMPATSFLPTGGIPGSVLAFLASGASMSIIAVNYHFLGNIETGTNGIFRPVEQTLGKAHAFAAYWAIGLAYLCCIPLNARAMGILIRIILSEHFHLDFHTYFLGTHILLIDACIVLIALLFFGWLNMRGIKQTAWIQTAGAIILIGGIFIMLIAALVKSPDLSKDFTPAAVPGTNPVEGFLTIFLLTPWAYVGFESLSHVTMELRFSPKKLGTIMVISVLCGTFAYLANIFIALLGMPPQYPSWPVYFEQLGKLSGIDAYPVANAARRSLGSAGTVIFFAACLSATLTGLIGFFTAISRLITKMAEEGVLTSSLSQLHPKRGTPVRAISIVVLLSLLVLLLLDAFDAIEELASFATSVAYGYCSLTALIKAVQLSSKKFIITGSIGTIFSLLWTILLLVPVRGFSTAISNDAIVCIGIWIFAGIAVYCLSTCKKDYNDRYSRIAKNAKETS